MKTHRLFYVLFLLLTVAVCSPVDAAKKSKEKSEPLTPSGAFVLEVAYSYKDGGKYIWKKSTGVPEDLVHKGEVILKKQPVGTYCCGYTLSVAFKTAQQFGVFDEFTPKQIKKFQSDWYGNTKETAERQGAMAMQRLKIGRQIKKWKDVRPGDFCNYWRKPKGGHSVIFLDWVTKDKKIVGIKYRSSQGSTDGIGDNTEYFHGKGGRVDPKRLYFYRFYTPEDKSKIERLKKKRESVEEDHDGGKEREEKTD
ncbi:hypothetical protein [Poriferisphaera sp. WC338]|uniref:hypothetical protein n=1 Tax=Poriferisphaera sp. WC338 TaxID=3425129 RepID=UPI003D816757